MIEAENLSKFYGDFAAIRDVSFKVYQGEVVAFLGPNGAGKSTTMKLLTGYLSASAGVARIAGHDMGHDRLAGSAKLGYLPENGPLYPDMTPRSLLEFFADARGLTGSYRTERIAAVVELCALGSVIGKAIGKLSRGYRQRVGMAQVLLHEPNVLILDEPTAGLDPRQVADTRGLIAKLGRQRSVLFSSHLLAEVSALCRRVVILDRGRVVATRDVAELSNAAGVTHLELRLTGDLAQAAALLRNLAGVQSAEVRGGRLVVRGTGGDLGQRLSAAVIGEGFGLVELRVEQGNLEEAYLRLVRE
jgi:ABC-2 type transport system ATP-binding protein